MKTVTKTIIFPNQLKLLLTFKENKKKNLVAKKKSQQTYNYNYSKEIQYKIQKIIMIHVSTFS